MTDHPTPWSYDDTTGFNAFLYDANGNKIHFAYDGAFRREDAERIVQAVNLVDALEDLAKLWAQEHERRLTVSKMLEYMKEQGE